MFFKIFSATLFILVLFLSACQGQTEEMNNKTVNEISETIKRQKEMSLITGFSPEAKLNGVVDYFNKRWPGYVWMSADYRFIPIPPVRDIVFSTVVIFPKIDNKKQIGEPPDTDSAIKEIIFMVSSKIQPKEIYITILQPNRADQLIFLNSGEEIRKNGILILEESVTRHLKNPVFLFSIDNLYEKSSYEPYKSELRDEKLKKFMDNWNKKWAGKVFIQGENSFSGNEPGSVIYFIEVGFYSMNTAEYLAEINKILGEIVYDSLQIRSIQDIKFFVIHANGDYFYYHEKDGSLGQARKYMGQEPKIKFLNDWSHFFVIKPFIINFY